MLKYHASIDRANYFCPVEDRFLPFPSMKSIANGSIRGGGGNFICDEGLIELVLAFIARACLVLLSARETTLKSAADFEMTLLRSSKNQPLDVPERILKYLLVGSE
jgi:hypothetical protein